MKPYRVITLTGAALDQEARLNDIAASGYRLVAIFSGFGYFERAGSNQPTPIEAEPAPPTEVAAGFPPFGVTVGSTIPKTPAAPPITEERPAATPGTPDASLAAVKQGNPRPPSPPPYQHKKRF